MKCKKDCMNCGEGCPLELAGVLIILGAKLLIICAAITLMVFLFSCFSKISEINNRLTTLQTQCTEAK